MKQPFMNKLKYTPLQKLAFSNGLVRQKNERYYVKYEQLNDCLVTEKTS